MMRLAFILSLMGLRLSAATYYTDSLGGNDSNSGLAGHPWLTIQHGLNTVAPGDTLVVTNGFFPETEPQTITSGTRANPIIILAATPTDGGTILTNGLMLFNSWYVIQGFTWWLYTNANSQGPLGQGLGFFAPNEGHCLVESNWFHSPPVGDPRILGFGSADAIYCAGNATPFTNGTDFNIVTNCQFSEMYQSNNVDLACIGLLGQNNLVISNLVRNVIDMDFCDYHGYSNRACWNYITNCSVGPQQNHNDCFQTWGNSGISPLISSYNSFDHNWGINNFSTTFDISSKDVLTAPGAAVGTNYWAWNVAIGEAWRGNATAGFSGGLLTQDTANGDWQFNNSHLINTNAVAEYSLRNLASAGNTNYWGVVLNTIISECSSAPENIDAGVPTGAANGAVTIDYNFATLQGGQTPATVYGTHNITSGFPGWINTNSGSYNLRLTNGSPCIAAGTNLTGLVPAFLTVDMQGHQMPATGPWDLGAFAFIGPPSIIARVTNMRVTGIKIGQ